MIPPPRADQVRYHGILAPAAGLRDRITPSPLEQVEAVAPKQSVAAGKLGDEPEFEHPERTRS